MNETDRRAVHRNRTETGVLHLIVDNPPVNALSHLVRAELDAALAEAATDPSVRAIVLRAEGRTFPAGADIAEFGHAPRPPLLPDLCDRIEACPKPVVAALHGSALGGGLELALAAHGRVAQAQARMGFPEISLGLLPGAGGTQRAPRLIGAEEALRMMLGGRPVSAPQALAMGLVDRVVEDGLPAAAEAEALALAERGAPLPTSERRDGMRDVARYQQVVAAARASLSPDSRVKAAERIVDCVEAALLLPFEQGMGFERAAFEDLVATPEAAALRHLFFAERAAARFPESGAAPRALKSLAVVGAGGAEVALMLLQAGFAVTLVEPVKSQLVSALEVIAAHQQEMVTAGKLTEVQRDADWARLKPAMDIQVAAQADMVLLAAPEHLEAVAAITTPGTPLAHLGKGAGVAGPRSADVLGVVLGPLGARLAEIIVAPGCAPETVATAAALVRRLGRTAVRTGAPGGIVPRMLTAGRAAAAWLVARGMEPGEIAASLIAAGIPVLIKAEPSALPKPALRDEVAARCLSAMAAEGLRLIARGVVLRPSDIDLAMILGAGFLRWQGGPMHWAETRGLLILRRDLRKWSADAAEIWGVPPLLDTLVSEGHGFDGLTRVREGATAG